MATLPKIIRTSHKSPEDVIAGTGTVTVMKVAAVLLLFAVIGSEVVAETVAVFDTLPENAGGVLYVDMMVADCPAAMVPRLQGYAVVQAPELETKVSDGGVGSLTVTPVAVDGPAFVTTIV